MNKNIGIFDSGIGGITTLKAIKNILPNENYVYVKDTKNNPYGEKNDKELYNIVKNNVNKLLKYDVKLIVIACNTATTKCIEKLRKNYPNMLFVGTEPAIKVACDNNYKNILVLATSNTINSNRTRKLVNSNKKFNQNIILLPCNGLANAIEKNDQIKIEQLLDKYLNKFLNSKIDSIVLGCTHYPYIKENIKKRFPDSKIIDGNLGVANRVKFLLKTNNLINHSQNKGNIKFIITK